MCGLSLHFADQQTKTLVVSLSLQHTHGTVLSRSLARLTRRRRSLGGQWRYGRARAALPLWRHCPTHMVPAVPRRESSRVALRHGGARSAGGDWGI